LLVSEGWSLRILLADDRGWPLLLSPVADITKSP
jgi:hypothetical protein